MTIFIFTPSISGLSSKQDESIIKNINLNDLCLENLDFKEKYFNLLNRIDFVVLREFDKDTSTSNKSDFDSLEYSLLRNLDTISFYTRNVSYTNLFDYSFGYKSLELYNSDKNKWIEFYENNKCNNLKWVDTLSKAKE